MPDKPSRPQLLPLHMTLLIVIGLIRREESLPTIHLLQQAMISIAQEEGKGTNTRARGDGMDATSSDAVMVKRLMSDAAAAPPPSAPPPEAGRDMQSQEEATQPLATRTQTDGVWVMRVMTMAVVLMVAVTMKVPMTAAAVPMMPRLD